MEKRRNIAILASGTGTNADRICAHFAGHPNINVKLIVSNKQDAGVLNVAQKRGVDTTVISNTELAKELLPTLRSHSIDFVVLAGFLRPIPDDVVLAYDQKMVNIHPSLLPKYGGKGMYGMRVHQSVLAAGESESGITIHYVNEHYDDGAIIFQASCPVKSDDTPESLASRIHELEHRHYPIIIEKLVTQTQ